MRRFNRLLSALIGFVVAVVMVAPAVAQPASPVPHQERPVGVLGTAQVDGLPTVAGEVWFIRFGLEPDGVLPLGLQIGPTVLVVESGELTIVGDQPIEVDGAVAESDSGALVGAGETAYVRENTTITLRNDGDAPVSTLALLMFSGMRESEEQEAPSGTSQPEPSGFSQQPLGVTQAEFSAGSGTVTIERVALDPGAAESLDVPGGAVAGGVEQGSVEATVERGNCFLWPGTMNPEMQRSDSMQGPPREQVRPGEIGSLSTNDGFGCSDPAIAWQAGGDGATIIRAVVRPHVAAGADASPVPIEAATPTAIAVESRPSGLLAEVPVDALPSPNAEVWFVRYSLDPGGTLPPAMQIGPTVAYVESGELTVTSDQPIRQIDTASASGATEVVVGGDHAVYLPENATIAARNDGDEPVVFDVLMTFAPEREVAAMESATPSGEPQGLTLLGGGVTQASFPEGPGVIRIARATLGAGMTVPYDATDGAIAGWVEQGGATVTVESGSCNILRPVPGGGDVDIEQVGLDQPGGATSTDVAVDDGFGCGGAVMSWQVGDANMTVLIAEVMPAR